MSFDSSLILTFPHRRGYFGFDDRFVNHFRRYELGEMETNLKDAGLKSVEIKKILGPLEKITMLSATLIVSAFAHFRKKEQRRRQGTGSLKLIIPVFQWLNRFYCAPVWLDACLAPRCLSSVLLIQAVKRH